MGTKEGTKNLEEKKNLLPYHIYMKKKPATIKKRIPNFYIS